MEIWCTHPKPEGLITCIQYEPATMMHIWELYLASEQPGAKGLLEHKVLIFMPASASSMLIRKLQKKMQKFTNHMDLINPLLSCLVPNLIHSIPFVLLTRWKETTQVFYTERQYPNHNHNSPIYNLDSSLSPVSRFPSWTKRQKMEQTHK
jgi:hypothetical protein